MVDRPGNFDPLSGLPRLIRATRILFGALAWGFRKEEALRLEMLALLVLVPLGLYLGQTPAERVLLIGSVALLLRPSGSSARRQPKMLTS